MAELAERESDFEKTGADLVVIGSGLPEHLDEFRKVTGYRGRLLTDPSRKAFRLLGFSGGVTGLISFKAVTGGLSALKEGHRQGPVQGSALQLGGAVVVDPEKGITWYFAGRKAGDHPKVDDLIKAAEG